MEVLFSVRSHNNPPFCGFVHVIRTVSIHIHNPLGIQVLDEILSTDNALILSRASLQSLIASMGVPHDVFYTDCKQIVHTLSY